MYSKPFHYTDEEAVIVAKWETGVRNTVVPMTVLLVVLIVAIEMVRLASGLALPGWSFLIADAAAVALFMLVVYYISQRVKQTARQIVKREIAVMFDDEQTKLSIVEYGDKEIYKCFYSDISTIHAGPNVVRISSKSGSICLPCSQVPEEFLIDMQKKLGANNYKILKWM